VSVAVDAYAENAENPEKTENAGIHADVEARQRPDEVVLEPKGRDSSPKPAGRAIGLKAGRKTARKRRAAGDENAGRAPDVRVSTLTDQALLEGLRSGSEWHFGELYHRYFQRIYNFVYARVRNHVECEEIVQETFIAVFRSFENYRGQSSLLSWIYGIAKNTTNNSLRRAKAQNERIDLVEEGELLPNAALGVPSPDDILDLHRFGAELAERLEQVADWQAEIFAMRHLENLSIPEISKRTRRSSDAVRSSLYRVKRIFFETALPGSGATLSAEDRA